MCIDDVSAQNVYAITFAWFIIDTVSIIYHFNETLLQCKIHLVAYIESNCRLTFL